MNLNKQTGLVDQARFMPSPNCDERENCTEPEVVVIHCISLPPGEYGGESVVDFFCNQLQSNAHPYLNEIIHLKVSAHFFIRRDGELIQFVPTVKRAWHAGESVCLGRPKVNDFSLGIELEGLDTARDGFTERQYVSLRQLLHCLESKYPAIGPNRIFAHSDIAVGRKLDPGPYFDWQRVLAL